MTASSPRRVPGLGAFPRVTLGHLPTPVDPAPRLGAAIGVDLLVKRDDCTGLAFGGNKVRQLEFYLGEARARGADVVLITGAVQSNFVRITAAAARRLGIEVHVQLEQRVSGMDELYRRSGNVLLDRLLGATVHAFALGEDEAAADRSLEAIAARLQEQGRHPYVIHLGVGHPPLGGLGYVLAAEEIHSEQYELDALVVASGSGLTHAGLLVGLGALDDATPVFGVCVRRDARAQHARVLGRAAEIESMLGVSPRVGPGDVHVTDAVLAPGYGRMNAPVARAIELAARLEGLFLDPVYTARTLAGLESLVGAGAIPRGARVLLVHTGGQPALFGYQRALEEALARDDARC